MAGIAVAVVGELVGSFEAGAAFDAVDEFAGCVFGVGVEDGFEVEVEEGLEVSASVGSFG